jgi:hypothetical protein
MPDGILELGFRGDDEATADLLARAIAAGHRVATFARAASDLEELFLQVTALDDTTGDAVATDGTGRSSADAGTGSA